MALSAPMRFALPAGALILATALGGTAAAGDLCTNMNTGAVSNGPPNHTAPCDIAQASHVTQLITYHWNGGRGAPPGTLELVNKTTGAHFGPFQASGSSGQGGAPNVNWTADVNIDVPAGPYDIVDSSIPTWSWNFGSGSNGFMKVEGEPTGASGGSAWGSPTPPRPPPPPPPPPPTSVLTHNPCHANSASFVELARPTCGGPRGTVLTLYVSRYGMKAAPTEAQLRSGPGYNSLSVQIGGAVNTPGLPEVYTEPLKLTSGSPLAPNSTYTFPIPPGACANGAGHRWWYDLCVPGEGDIDTVYVTC